MRKSIPALGENDEIVLWNGGIWNWLDAPRAVRAFALLSRGAPRRDSSSWAHPNNPAGCARARSARDRRRPRAAGRRRLLQYELGPLQRARRLALAADCAISSTKNISRRGSHSARACSTASGRGCRWFAATATSSLRAWPRRAGRGGGARRPRVARVALEQVLDRGRAVVRSGARSSRRSVRVAGGFQAAYRIPAGCRDRSALSSRITGTRAQRARPPRALDRIPREP